MIGIKLITFTCDFTGKDRERARIERLNDRERERKVKKKHATRESHFQKDKR